MITSKKGQYCTVYTRAYDACPAGWRLVRVVKVDPKGYITHVVPNSSWTKSTKGNSGNSLKAKFVCADSLETSCSVMTIGEYADYDLSDLDGEIYPELDQVKKALTEG